jgi:hypothetical protein
MQRGIALFRGNPALEVTAAENPPKTGLIARNLC